MIKIFSTAVVSALLISSGVAAQNHEVSFAAGTGLSGIHYAIQNGSSSIQPGFQAGAGYARFFNPRWGIATGLELGYYQAKAKLDPNTVFSTYEMDSEGDAFEYRVKTKGYEETQNLFTVDIPLMLQYQSLPKHKLQFYSLAGLQLSLPISSRYKTSADQISASGYYPDLNVEFTDLPVHGFGTQTNWKKEGVYTFNMACALSAEAGAKIPLSVHSYLYVGTYIDYGINDLKKEQGHAALLTYNPTSLSQSQATGVFSLAHTTGNARLLAYGIKLRLAFHVGKNRKAVSYPAPEINKHVQPPIPVKSEENPQAETLADPMRKPDNREIKSENSVRVKVVQQLLSPADEAVLKTPIQFARVGDTALSAASKAQADSLGELMQRNPNMNLLIEGHTCDLGGEAINNRVGLARAKAVVMYLEQKGIDGGRMHAVSKGAEEPVVPNTSEANRRQNRRVVIKVIDKQKG